MLAAILAGDYRAAGKTGIQTLLIAVATAITLGEGAAALAGGKGAGTAAIGNAENAAVREATAASIEQRAHQVHGALHPVAQRMRTTVVLDTNAGRIVAGGGPDLTPAQRALLKPGEIAAQLPDAHAEITALEHAAQINASPSELAVTRNICSNCEKAITTSGGTLTSKTSAVWKR